MKTVLVTGSTGCIGKSTVAWLLNHGADRVVGFSRKAADRDIPQQWTDRVSMMAGDIADAESVRRAMRTIRPTHVIHLAAFQTPDCKAHPFRGMDINVTGTMNLCKAAAESGSQVERFVCASSIAVNGPRHLYPGSTIRPSDPFLPSSLYGFWEVANEGCGQAYHMETGIPTISVRLATTYGPGRDRGMTSAPTSAIKAVARGQAFRMPYAGREHYHFVADVGAGFGQCAFEPFEGYGVFHLRGVTVSTQTFIDQLEAAAQRLGVHNRFDVAISHDAIEIPFACDFDDQETCRVFPRMPLTKLECGIENSLATFLAEAEAGTLDAADNSSEIAR